jgi:hypothetical protein
MSIADARPETQQIAPLPSTGPRISATAGELRGVPCDLLRLHQAARTGPTVRYGHVPVDLDRQLISLTEGLRGTVSQLAARLGGVVAAVPRRTEDRLREAAVAPRSTRLRGPGNPAGRRQPAPDRLRRRACTPAAGA